MKKVINLYKKIGESPLDAINRFREKNIFYKKKKMSYAGRLDPMAEGVLLILVGDETKKINQYLGFDKEYKAGILIGLSTDTGDVLGIAYKGELLINNYEIDEEERIKQASKNHKYEESKLQDTNNEQELIKKLKKRIKELKGRYEQKIPNYSSYRIKGKPMFYYARKGEILEEIKKVVYIKSIKISSIYKISSKKLLKYVVNKIDKVKGDFRQEEIKENWMSLLDNNDRGTISKLIINNNKDNKIHSQKSLQNRKDIFLVIDVTINCSSGTYIRAIADDIGKQFGGGLLLSLKRIRVGKFKTEDSVKV
ncbi:MAG: hypothetical protein AABW90_00175 [Nanoarchaeota archaeon]